MNRRRFLGATPLPALLSGLKFGGNGNTAQAAPISNDAAPAPAGGRFTSFDSQAFAALPMEKSYTFHKVLSQGERQLRRSPQARPSSAEVEIPQTGWSILTRAGATEPLRRAVEDLREYLEIGMRTKAPIETAPSLADWASRENSIVVGTREDLPGCGAALNGSKDYQIQSGADQIVVCGYDELGAAHGLYNLEERMDLREAPFLPRDLNTSRHSLYKVRMTMSGLGWMEWPDKYLACVARNGFDAIFISVYANPNGEPVPSWLGDVAYGASYRFRKQDPANVRDVARRAAAFGIRVYCPIMYRLDGTPENEEELRRLIRDTVTRIPEIHGYILLTEGFWYKTWFGAGGHGSIDLRDWIRNWAQGVSIVAEECHKLDPTIEVLPWDYNIDFRASQVETKKYVIDELPLGTIPLVTWENGQSFTFDGETGYARDYSVSLVGPSEAAAAQIAEAKKRGMRGIYTNGDTWSSQQFGTFPYLPFPYQWYQRYQAMQQHGVQGTLESWSPGLNPNFIVEMRNWYCWSDAPPIDDLLRRIARRDFGQGSEELALEAWKHLSDAVRMVPDTGPTSGGNNAVANPLFFQEPEDHIMTLKHSFWDQKGWMDASSANPYWPYVFRDYLFYPDLTNRTNLAEQYAKPFSIKVFTEQLQLAADGMEKGLESYRKAALNAPPSKRLSAFREVLLAEHVQRMVQSNKAIVEFESLRFRLAKTPGSSERRTILDQMAGILEAEIARTEASLETARRDSRLGYEWENDYMYWPAVIEKKLELLRLTLAEQIPDARRSGSV